MSLQFGYIISPEYPSTYSVQDAVRQQRQTVSLVRDVGMSAVISGEHYSFEAPRVAWLPPMMLLSRVCDAGEGLLFGTGVLVAPLHHPVVLAEQAAFMDAVTGGRFVLGLAAGWNPREFEVLGVPVSERGRRLEETIQLMRRLWTSPEPEDFSGRFYQFRDLALGMRPTRPGGPPIWLGGSSVPAVERAARIGDGWLISSHVKEQAAIVQSEVYRNALATNASQAPAVRPALRNVFVGRTREEAVRAAGPFLTASYEGFGRSGLFSEVLKEEVSAVDYELASARAVIGSVEDVAAELTRFVRLTGANVIFARSQWLGIPASAVNRSLELLGTEVLPLVRSELGDDGRRPLDSYLS